ncbi:class I adenylate-forming enzyme family protein [uncultured Tateyamaria sp.]|uniref:class I adenylate-forming enzyme family protein n=1 Tax=uncultured Tateyamaria sp. TaxID=455651 RepID=UPI00261C7996|nr:class I adenylate-forming enzyme family protein [uncultured Tateyamaria sp.]
MLSVVNSGHMPPCPSPFNMAAHVLQHADTQPEKVAVSVVDDVRAMTMTYGALQQAVLGTGGGFLAAGCTPGDTVLLRLGNTIDFPIAYLGALAVGLVPVPTSAALTETEVAQILRELSPRLILRDPDVASAPGAPEIGLATLQALRDHPPADWHMDDPERLGYIVYTSGTSGQPRAVAHAHRAIWARQMMHDGWYGLTSEDVLMHAGAFNWTYTLGTGLMDPWTVGATAMIPRAGTDPANLGGLMARHGATIFAAAPGVYRQMLERSRLPPLPALRHGLSAGEKLPQTTRDAWHKATGTDIFEAYGMSECSTFISSCPDSPAAPGALGQAQPGRHVAILGDDGPTPPGTPGTIAVHRSDPGLMLEYLHAPEDTAARFQDDWFLTGDVGSMDADGHITYLGRNDDMMNAGGYRVSPIEVEAALADAPGLTGVGATQIEVKPGVFIIAAFYTSPTPLDEDSLRAYVGEKLARYKHPRAYVHVPMLPTGANGKLVRRRLPLFWPKDTKVPNA